MSDERKYSQIYRKLGIVIPIIVVAILIAGCSTGFISQGKGDVSTPSSSISSNGPTNGLVQADTGGSVTIDVEWMGTENGLLTFAVAMNTHSVDLDGYDLGKLAVLRDDGEREYHPASWESASGGHHRRGILTFSPPDSLSQEKAKYLELVIRGIDGVDERVFRWELG